MSDTLNDGTGEATAPAPAVETAEAPAVETGASETESTEPAAPEPKPAASPMPAWRIAQREAKVRAENEALKRQLDAYQKGQAHQGNGRTNQQAPQTYDENQLWVQNAVAPAIDARFQPIAEQVSQLAAWQAEQRAYETERRIEDFWKNQDVPEAMKAEVEERVEYAYAAGELDPRMSPLKARELALKLKLGELYEQERRQKLDRARISNARQAQANKVASAEGAPSAPAKAAAKHPSEMTFEELGELIAGKR